MTPTQGYTIEVDDNRSTTLMVDETNTEIVLLWKRPILDESDKELPKLESSEPISQMMYIQDGMVHTAIALSRESAIATYKLLNNWLQNSTTR